MKIAVPYENGQVIQHFGHIQQMKIYDAENGKMVQEQIADTTGGHCGENKHGCGGKGGNCGA